MPKFSSTKEKNFYVQIEKAQANFSIIVYDFEIF